MGCESNLLDVVSQRRINLNSKAAFNENLSEGLYVRQSYRVTAGEHATYGTVQDRKTLGVAGKIQKSALKTFCFLNFF